MLLAREGPEAEATAVALATRWKEEGKLRCFGAATAVPKRAYSLAELRLNKIEVWCGQGCDCTNALSVYGARQRKAAGRPLLTRAAPRRRRWRSHSQQPS